ncbi:MAG: antibiotic biosynthesis monooxygenase [Alphaproteobacteria bacterium]|nr:MAG: antibiotic biosynthesis monooxygenase [Alphaproteobacteria bacterium]
MSMAACSSTVTIITQTTVRAECRAAFEAWQAETSRLVKTFVGFIQQTLLPPSPPAQDYWVVMQRFLDSDSAIGWLNSPQRLERLTMVQPYLTGRADVHVVRGMADTPASAPVSAIMSTRVKPGRELEYRAWEQKIAVAQSAATGLVGYRFEPPIPGVQADWLTIMRFDTQENLQAWLDSPVRQAILAEAEPLTEGFDYRVTRSGFDQWFPVATIGGQAAPVWKQNLVVLSMLFPVSFLFGHFVSTPLLIRGLGLPFPLALLVSNICGILLLNQLVPAASQRFAWWLLPAPGQDNVVRTIQGVAVIGLILVALATTFVALG